MNIPWTIAEGYGTCSNGNHRKDTHTKDVECIDWKQIPLNACSTCGSTVFPHSHRGVDKNGNFNPEIHFPE